MSWVRLDDCFPEHPKVLEAGPDAAWLFVCGLAYAARHLTDGLLTTTQVARLPARTPLKLSEQLVKVGLWEHVEGGYQIHDYLSYQPSRAEVLAKRERNAQIGALGGRKRKPSDALSETVTETLSETLSETVTETLSETLSAPLPVSLGRLQTPVPNPVPVPHEASTQDKHLPETPALTQDMLSAAAPPDDDRPRAGRRTAPKAPKPVEPSYPPEFESFWSAFPRRQEKPAAFKAWSGKVKAGLAAAVLEQSARHYGEHVRENATEAEYVAKAANWINRGAWIDFRDGVPRPARRPSTAPAPNGTGPHIATGGESVTREKTPEEREAQARYIRDRAAAVAR